MSVIINIKDLSKSYQVHQKEPGFIGSIQGLFNRRYKTITAVDNISLSIQTGELVGFIGPNGAGKTTTLKMLSGLLYPTSGTATVMDYTPWQRKRDFLKNFSLVMGQKAQLWWDLPLYDSLLLQRDIYEIDKSVFRSSLQELTELLDLDKFLKVQVRKLSLGQRMRGELAAALVYHPQVLLLDEPTIGLDIVVQKKVRKFIKQYQQKYNATIILTSHYLDDVRELARRLVIIDHGRIAYDGSTENLIKQHVDHRRIVLTFFQPVAKTALLPYGQIIKYQPLHTILHVPRNQTTKRAAQLLTKFPVEDISIDEPSLENVVRELFTNQNYA
ncbi:MAG: ABC transporter [Candidatus Andersenbacteria bacterium RIFCSPLOWO2_02_FULL_46_11]|nr:MAG: ABC transporter [Candidatus Andersenbacteria bacterium RIFCSPHIGHO2_02_FULL_46_16]OGY36754.1 MAG: ABC transporter [Candidatus Andersenbacteria bacterium RIFCSPLOWO2_02_FULL_46_11]